MRLKEVTISGFRGFQDRKTLNLAEDVILVKGLNGTGKSSLVEALEWLFFDEISRKKKSLCRSEYAGGFLRNIHCGKTQETFVEVLADTHGKEIRLKKKWLSPKKSEYYINDALVEDFSCLGISFAEVCKPILAQVEIKHYVETDPKDRWEETNKILGLGVLSEFRSALQELLNAKKNESRYESPRKTLYGLESELDEVRELEALSVAMARRPFSFQSFEEEIIRNITETYSLKAATIDELSRSIDEEIRKLVRKDTTFESTQTFIVPDRTIVISPLKLTGILKHIFDSLTKLRTVNIDVHKFLEIGKRLIENSTCPFCLEETLTDKKIRTIEERMKDTKEAMKSLSDINAKLVEIRELREDMTQKIALSINISTMEKVKDGISQDPEYTNETNQIDDIMKQISKFNKIFDRFDGDSGRLIHDAELILEGKAQLDKAKLESETTILEKHATETKYALGQIRDNLQSLLSALVSKTPSLSTKEKTELSKALLFRRIVDHLDDIKYVGIYESNLNQVSELIEKVEKFEKVKSRKMLTSLSKQIKEFYSTLNPNEKIQFSEIVPTKGKSRRIRIKATSYGKNINPVSCFSESHMNCLCLSIYFCQRVLNNPHWRFLVLDDPVQSMDEHHGKNLIRTLAKIAKERQVIVLSHNARFCQDFRDLFYGTDLLFYEFSGYSQRGPRIDLKQAPLDTYISLARDYCNGNMEERAIAANNLRKAIERLTLDILIHRGRKGRGKASELNLDKRLEKIETAKLITLGEIGEIKAILNVCDAGSHEPPRREVTPQELLDGIVAIENLASKHLK